MIVCRMKSILLLLSSIVKDKAIQAVQLLQIAIPDEEIVQQMSSVVGLRLFNANTVMTMFNVSY